jgi:hypothetical protein
MPKAAWSGLTRFFVAMTARVRWVILAYVVTRLLAIVIFGAVESWTPMDAYWWGEVASLTIGYGDLAPETTLGRLLAGPFHFFWVYYCGLAFAGHIVTFLFRNMNILTHMEQEWLFRVVTIVFDWVRWTVMAVTKIAEDRGVQLEPPPHRVPGGLMTCPPQASDTEQGDVAMGEKALA